MHPLRRGALDCRTVVELLTAYLDDALEPRAARRVARHLRGCRDCSRFLAQLVTTVSLLRLAARGR